MIVSFHFKHLQGAAYLCTLCKTIFSKFRPLQRYLNMFLLFVCFCKWQTAEFSLESKFLDEKSWYKIARWSLTYSDTLHTKKVWPIYFIKVSSNIHVFQSSVIIHIVINRVLLVHWLVSNIWHWQVECYLSSYAGKKLIIKLDTLFFTSGDNFYLDYLVSNCLRSITPVQIKVSNIHIRCVDVKKLMRPLHSLNILESLWM